MSRGDLSFACLAMLVACTSSGTDATDRAVPDPPEQARASHDETDSSPNLLPSPYVAVLENHACRCEGEQLREEFLAHTRDDLEHLVHHGPSLRLLAIWEQDRRFADDGTLVPTSVDRLARELEAELGQPVPRWWLEQLASAKQRPGDPDGPPYYDIGLTEHGDRRGEWQPGPGDTRVRPAGALLLSETKGQLSYDFSMGRVVLGPLPEPGAMIEHARRPGATTVYYAAFSQGSGGFRFPLHAVGVDGKLAWTTEVCGPNRQILGGIGHLTVEIVVLDSGVGIAVFTAETHGVALDVFDPKTGARTLGWSSDFWFAR